VKFRTRSGSVYELDEARKLARQVEGRRSSERMSNQWRPYADAMVVVGLSAFITWTSDTPLLAETSAQGLEAFARPATQTSEVVEILSEVLH
jgi:hypothetical protein